ncbi:MAG: DUF262 domain-containing protein, partial [Mucilaginibacter sp.]
LTGLSSDWLEIRSQGFESEAEVETTGRQPGYGPDDIFVENKPFSLRQIVDLIEFGDIELTPDFQRNFIWDRTRQSKLIESILLGLPLPSIYLSQYEDGRLTVVDGLQRLSTIHAFLNDELRLFNLEYLTECNNKTYGELQSVLPQLRIRRFSQTQIMCFVIDYRSPSKLKFDLFKRLNTGGKPLNNQEIRNCLSRPTLQRILKEMVQLPSFAAATDNSVKDARMDAREAALRFIYFSEQYSFAAPVGIYNGDMEGTLDDFIDNLNDRTEESLNKFVSLYEKGLRNAYHLFGRYCFRKVLPDTLYERRTQVNKLLMLTFSVLLSRYDTTYIQESFHQNALVEPLSELIDNDEDLFRAITWSTNSKWNIETGFLAFQSFLFERLGHGITFVQTP